jgi:hypothetical protein
MHVDKTVWNGLTAEQRAAILRAARESVAESYQATESIACRKLKDMLDVNDGINQRNRDGTVRLVDGKPVSARITMTPWPEEALKVLRIATTAYLSSLAGPSEASARSEAQREFSTVLDAMTRFAASAGTTKLADFPATTGLAPGEACRLAP